MVWKGCHFAPPERDVTGTLLNRPRTSAQHDADICTVTPGAAVARSSEMARRTAVPETGTQTFVGDRRREIPEARPPVSGFECPSCASQLARLGVAHVYYFYLSCDVCGHVWSQAERRRVLGRRPDPLTRPS
jgi:hypothetical protein